MKFAIHTRAGRVVSVTCEGHQWLFRFPEGNGIPDASESLGIVARGSGPQADLLAVLAGNHPLSVELDLVQPAGASGRSLGERRLAGQDEAGRLGTGSERTGNSPENMQPKGWKRRAGGSWSDMALTFIVVMKAIGASDGSSQSNDI